MKIKLSKRHAAALWTSFDANGTGRRSNPWTELASRLEEQNEGVMEELDRIPDEELEAVCREVDEVVAQQLGGQPAEGEASLDLDDDEIAMLKKEFRIQGTKE